MLDDQAVESLRAIQPEFLPDPPIERAQRGHPVHDDAAVRLAAEAFRATGRLCRELADDLLDDVLDRHQSLELAVFIHHETEALPVCLKLLQLRQKWRSDGDEVRRSEQRS